MPACGLCGADVAKLAKSHIIPDSMTKELAGGEPLLALRATHAHNVRGGVYDRIVCRACEASFHSADDYAIAFRRQIIRGTGVQKAVPGTKLALRAHRGDPMLLHRFALQTLLRAHLSQRPEHAGVRLGKDWLHLANAVRRHGAESLPAWPASVRYIGGPSGAAFMAPETQLSGEGVPVHVLTFPHMTIMVTAPSTGPIPAFLPTSLRPGTSIVVWHARKWAPREFELLAGAVERHSAAIDRLRGLW
jgi:hypothetical protein